MKLYRRTLSLLAVCAAALMLVPVDAQQGNGQVQELRQNNGRFHRHPGKNIPNNYIVVLDQDPVGATADFGRAAADADQAILKTRTGRIKHVYAHALVGFAAEMSEEDAITLANDPSVAYVEEDTEMEIVTTQTGATWGLDRIDQADLPLNGNYVYTSTGSGVTAYIIDTGIRTSHSQFGGRASVGFDAMGGNGQDCNGHGTHVAGTVGGSTYGVAKGVRLVAVRVLSCSGSGSTSGVIAGVDFVTSNHATGARAVANMSLGGGVSTALDTAVNNSINDGVTYAIAAGNSNANASNSSPARVAAAITVGSSTRTDARSSFSNFGSVVDIFAPGSSITSAWSTSDTATNTISGTSMATPHVAGMAARILQSGFASPASVRNTIVNTAQVGTLTGIPSGTANRLLFRLGSQ